jgi:hypothetical protein
LDYCSDQLFEAEAVASVLQAADCRVPKHQTKGWKSI